MKNIFLYAKYFAIERSAQSINIGDLKNSVSGMSYYIHLVDGLADILSEEVDIYIPEVTINKEDGQKISDAIEKASEIERISFTHSVKEILTRLETYGYSIEEETVKIDHFNDAETFDDTVFEEEDVPPKEKEIDPDDPILRAISLRDELSSKIYGQDIAIDAVVDSVKNKVVDSTDMPAHTFLFLGPSATGKTYMAKTIAENFEEYEFLEINMQNYTDERDGLNIFGTESRYGNSSPGDLTQFVLSNPKSVVLLDEFEKAHQNIQKKLLTIFSEGYINDLNGWIQEDEYDDDSNLVPYNSTDDDHQRRTNEIVRKVDFTQTIFVITSNLGSSLYNNSEFLEHIKNDYEKAETMIIQTLLTESKQRENGNSPAILPEMLSRLSQGKIVLFNKLSFQNLYIVAEKIFSMKLRTLFDKYTHIKFKTNEQFEPFLKCMLLQFAPYMDIRRIKSKVYERFSDQITDWLVEHEKSWKDIDTISIEVSSKVLKFLEKEVNPKIKEESLLKHLFRKNLTLNIEYKLELVDGTFTLKIEKALFEKVRNIEDMIGDGAITFDVPDTTFKDIAGHEAVKGRLKEIAKLLKEPEHLIKFGAKIPKGMLLHGVPGTGKTMLARAFANYADLPFIQTTANDLIDPGKNNLSFMKNVFRRARDYSPSIVFIDELDTFGSRKKNGSKAVINELLTQINGFSENPDESIFIIAATNHKDEIDNAILRPGRLELHVEIPTLDAKGREYFINKMVEKSCDKNVDISRLVMYSAGMTGAGLEKVANESSLYALRHGLDRVTEDIILEHINIEKYGKRITGKSIEDMLGETAYHEAGHAIISKVLNPNTKIEQITVTPREDTLGFVSYDVEGSNSNPSKKDIENKICVAYAGRIAQMKQYEEGGLDTGASSDLRHATRLAFLMVASFGMDEKLGDINLEGALQVINHNNNLLDNTFLKAEVEKRVKENLKALKTKTEELVNEHWEKIDKLANELLKKEVIHEDELDKIMKIK